MFLFLQLFYDITVNYRIFKNFFWKIQKMNVTDGTKKLEFKAE